MRSRLDGLREPSTGPSPQLGEVLEELQVSLEELSVAEEELEEEGESLATANRTLQEEHRRYRALFDFTPGRCAMTNPDGLIREANFSLTELLNVPRDRLVGKPMGLYVSEADRRTARTLLTSFAHKAEAETFAAEVAARWVTQEFSLQPRSGSPFPASVTIAPIRDSDGNLQGLRWLCQDITERKRMEAALHKAYDELDQKVQERTKELAQTVEALTTEMARRIQAEEALRDRSEQLRRLASELTLAEQRERRRFTDLLHDGLQQLLVAARFQVRSLEKARGTDLLDQCREVVDLLDRAIVSTRTLTSELSPPILHTGGMIPALEWLGRWLEQTHQLTVAVRAEPTALAGCPHDMSVLLFQSVRELLLNVAKHAKVPAVSVEIARRDVGVEVVVADAGVGFNLTRLRLAGGMEGGFGLFSIRERVELLGGRLEIDSAPGKGSRFALWVPVPRVEAAGQTETNVAPVRQEPTTETVGTAATPSVGRGKRKIRVLVVDDHRVVRQGLIRLLRAEPDIDVVGEAADGRAAVTLTSQLAPDVVTMEIQMPEMTGIEATRLIHSACPAASVIGLSIVEEAVQAAAMREAGAVNYLTKSGPFEDLVAAIRISVPATPGGSA